MSVPRPVSIVHVIHRLATGGLENGLVNLVNTLPADRFRHAIVCLTDATAFASRIRRPDIAIIELHKPSGNSLRIQQQLYRAFRDLAADVVHTRNLGALEAQFAAALARVPVRIHGEHGWDVVDEHARNRRHIAIRKLFSPFVHRYVALSEHIETYLRERVGIAAPRIERIVNGVDCERFHPSPSERASFPYPGFRDPALVLVGTVGRLEPVKDQLALARAFVTLLERAPELRRWLRLVIVGSGSLRDEIERLLAAQGATDISWLAGEREDVPQLMRALDVFVLPSRAEGISNTILEAMASGLPVVATAVGGNGELVRHGVTGALVPPNDMNALAHAIHELARDGALRTAQGAAARCDAVERFSLARMVTQYARLYDGEPVRRARRAADSTSCTRDKTRSSMEA
jgi:sugar transferase (PEP-CTERM/EpsH1 system associated)